MINNEDDIDQSLIVWEIERCIVKEKKKKKKERISWNNNRKRHTSRLPTSVIIQRFIGRGVFQ